MLTTNLQTKPCPECDKPVEVFEVPVEAYERYENGATIQEAFPMLTADQREQVISGYHGACYEALMDVIDEQFASDLDDVVHGKERQ